MASLDGLYLVINRVRGEQQLAIIDRFARVVKRYLTLNLRPGGGLPFEPDMDASIIGRTPFIVQHPESDFALMMKPTMVILDPNGRPIPETCTAESADEE